MSDDTTRIDVDSFEHETDSPLDFIPGSQHDSEYVICPYCGHEHGDAWEMCPQPESKELECCGCGQIFLGYAEYDVTYNTRPAP